MTPVETLIEHVALLLAEGIEEEDAVAEAEEDEFVDNTEDDHCSWLLLAGGNLLRKSYGG